MYCVPIGQVYRFVHINMNAYVHTHLENIAISSWRVLRRLMFHCVNTSWHPALDTWLWAHEQWLLSFRIAVLSIVYSCTLPFILRRFDGFTVSTLHDTQHVTPVLCAHEQWLLSFRIAVLSCLFLYYSLYFLFVIVGVQRKFHLNKMSCWEYGFQDTNCVSYLFLN